MENITNSSPDESVTSATARGNTAQQKHCLNCNTVLLDVYCSHCGQKDIPRRQTLSELVLNFVSSFSGYESKFFKTCKYLVLRPGFLANEYNAGRRESYFHPSRMYVFISFIYFFLFAALPDVDDKNSVLKITKDGKVVDYSELKSESLDDLLETREHYDSVQSTLPLGDRDGWLARKWKYREFELRGQFVGNPGEFVSHVVDEFTSHFSVVFFFLLPVFAMFLRLLYLKSDFFYSEHLVFSICFYNFFFLAGSLSILAETVTWLKWAGVLLELAILVYLLLAMKRTYRQGWGNTILKYASFLVLFGICIMLGLLVNLFITLMFV